MSCYNPLIAYQNKYIKTKNGKNTVVIMPNKIINNSMLAEIDDNYYHWDRIELPCGKCIGCRLDYAKNWAIRCTQEAKEHESNIFLTLTYNDENLKLNTKGINTLYKKDLQDFLKRLRRYYEYTYKHVGIRFFACGEYGTTTFRPHYHAIIFNLPIFTELKLVKINKDNQPLYTNEEIAKIWGKGQITIGEVTYQSTAYVARYILKKIDDNKELMSDLDILPEFIDMSRKPGIGKNYFLSNQEKIELEDKILCEVRNGKSIYLKPPKYYEKFMDPKILESLKLKRREQAINTRRLELENTSLNREEYLKLKERNKKRSLQNLPRYDI